MQHAPCEWRDERIESDDDRLLLALGRCVAKQPAFGALDGCADVADAHNLKYGEHSERLQTEKRKTNFSDGRGKA